MLGAIIGDIIGSAYEFHNIKTKDFPLFCEKSCFTDDTILTCATANWIMTGGSPDTFLKKWGNLYLNRSYENGLIAPFGKGFTNWLKTGVSYHAHTNGCVMRLSPLFKLTHMDDAMKYADMHEKLAIKGLQRTIKEMKESHANNERENTNAKESIEPPCIENVDRGMDITGPIEPPCIENMDRGMDITGPIEPPCIENIGMNGALDAGASMEVASMDLNLMQMQQFGGR